jgi:uncharacterized SAM-binding protein YcdF (DUF218 family)
VAEFVNFLFSIGGLMAVLAVGFVWLFVRPKQLAAARFIVCVLAAYALASMYPASHALASFVVAGYHPLEKKDVPAGRTAIVLLGSGSFVSQDWDDNRLAMADPVGDDRALEATRVYRLIDPEWIISSGGSVGTMDRDAPGGKVMADILMRLGVPPSRILLELDSQTTHDEAVLIKPMLERLGIEHVVLVTSDIHMRRSAGAFRAEGIQTIPAIARRSHWVPPFNVDFIPSETGLEESREVSHEILGMGYYTLRGWYK